MRWSRTGFCSCKSWFANCELVVDNPSIENSANRHQDTDVWTNKISKWKRTDYDTMRR